MQMEQVEATAYSDFSRRTTEAGARVQAADGQGEARSEASKAKGQNGFSSIAEPIEKLLKSVGVELKFNIHEDTGEVQAEVLDSEGKKVIRKVPPDEQLELAASIKKLSNVFLNRSL